MPIRCLSSHLCHCLCHCLSWMSSLLSPRAGASRGLGASAVLAGCVLAALGWSGDGPVHHASAQLLPLVEELPDMPIEQWSVVGSGPTQVVLVPGLACDGSVFEDFMQARSLTYTFHALTLPGMVGTTPPDPEASTTFTGTPWLDNAVLAIAHYIDQQGLNKPLVMGHAMGGTIAIRLAIEYPELISGVITLDGFPAVPLHRPVTPEQRHQTIMSSVAARLLEQSEEEWYRSTDMMASMFTVNDVRNQELAALFRTTPHPIARRYMLEFYLTDPGQEKLAEVALPVLAVASIDLQTASIADQRGGVEARRQRWRDAMQPFSKGMLVFAEDCKHFLFDDCPGDVDAAIAMFLKANNLLPDGVEDAQPAGPGGQLVPTPKQPEPGTPTPQEPAERKDDR